MSSAFPVINTSFAGPDSTRTWTTSLSSGPVPLVTLTSIQTETIYPTWVFTISDQGPGSSSTTTTVLVISWPTLSPNPATTALTTAQQSITEQDTVISSLASTIPTVSEPPTPTLSPPTTALSSPMEEQPISATSETRLPPWHPDASNSMWILPFPPTSSSISLSSPLSTLPETTASSTSTSTSSSTASTNESSIYPSTGVVTDKSTSSNLAKTESSSPTSSKIGTIVGSILGGSALTIFTLLACALFLRRRRRKKTTERLGIRQKLLRGDSMTSSIGYHRYSPSPSIPDNISSKSQRIPVIPLQQQPSNPDLSLDGMYLRGERTAQDPFADPSVLAIAAPSRAASFYSSSTRDCERESADVLAGPRASMGYLHTSVMRDSMRSDPFDLDLEPPPSAHHRPPVPPLSTPWGVRF
ncbi:uncharacterized protein N7515_001952 [Penicillium bovifimosum]|uniref:Uncharacterized protein n=1 Tax=Penicillium bovifimosum TaxID=126998 RepID=A0A9W9HAP6_9EURO|nr:uncharacterized protein N7515_001952 [Penicillium bovifimosum]KAJ5143165.1 hypothetical protein N7515_001952 [Penicillium bovifimosum]